MIVDNGHTLVDDKVGASLVSHFEKVRYFSSRLVVTTSEILKGVKDANLKYLTRQIQKLVK